MKLEPDIRFNKKFNFKHDRDQEKQLNFES